MVVKHCAYGVCRSDSRYLKDANISFMLFPNPKKETERCKRWLTACRRPNFTLKKLTRYSYICSLHFIGENGPTDVNPDPISATFSQVPLAREKNLNEDSISQTDEDINTKNNLEEININDPVQCLDENTDPCMENVPTSSTSSETPPATSNNKSSMISRQRKLRLLVRKYRLSNNIKQRKINILENKLNFQSFNIDVVRQNRKRFKFYSGLNVEQFDVFWRFLGEEALNLDDWRGGGIKQKRRQKKDGSSLTPQNQLFLLFLTLCRLRVGLLIEDLAYRFSVSISYVSRMVNTWIMFMYVKFKALNIFPSREPDRSKTPKIFRKFKNIRCIIDGFEFRTQKAEDYREQGNTYSAYKGQATFKFLCRMHPSGGVCFLSDAYEGAISDRDIFISCGITSLLEKGDLVMADRGFNVADICNSLHWQLLTPPYLAGRDTFTRVEVRTTKDIASARVHVGRVIGRIKEYRILQRILPKTLVPVVSPIAFVIAMLVNFQEPLVKN